MASCDCLFCGNLVYGRDYAEAVVFGDGRMHADCADQFNHEQDAAFGPDDGPEWDGDFDLDLTDEPSDGYTDVEADANTLASAGWGTDEDYGCYDGGFYDE